MVLVSGLLVFSGGYGAPVQKASYGTRVTYVAGKKIDFADFTIEFVGERRTTSQVYPRGFLYYDFKVTKGKSEKTVSWTSGTGLIGPMQFEIGGKNYQLELRHSNRLRNLRDNELVIWQGQ